MGRHEMSSATPEPETVAEGVNVAAGDDLHERPENTHLTIYLVAFALFVGLAVWGLAVFHHNEDDAQAKAKATELAAQFSAAGLTPIDVDATARVLGTDGAAVCADGSALREGQLDQQLVSGAAGPGQRPVIVTRDLVEGERLVLTVYCPDRVADFDQYVENLKLVDGE